MKEVCSKRLASPGIAAASQPAWRVKVCPLESWTRPSGEARPARSRRYSAGLRLARSASVTAAPQVKAEPCDMVVASVRCATASASRALRSIPLARLPASRAARFSRTSPRSVRSRLPGSLPSNRRRLRFSWPSAGSSIARATYWARRSAGSWESAACSALSMASLPVSLRVTGVAPIGAVSTTLRDADFEAARAAARPRAESTCDFYVLHGKSQL